MVVLLYKSGIPVKLTNDFSELKFDIEGFLIEFTYKTVIEKNIINTKYLFYNKSSFKTADKKRSDLTDGFYDEKQFLKYIENTGPNIPLGSDMIYKHKFNFPKFIAKAGDPISVSVTNFDAPYDLFYDRKKYDFTIENTIDNRGVRSYSDGILDGFETVDYKLRLPSNFTSSIINIPNQINSPGYYFYLKNLGQFLNQYTNDNEKRKLKKITILIIFKIRDIVKNIFPNILNDETSEAVLEAVANDVDTELNNLSELEKMIFLLYKSWGYYYDPNSNRPHRNNLPLIAQQPSYQDLESYYTALVSFYSKCYKIPHALSTFPADIKYEYLLEILPVSALSIIPFEVKKSIIESFIKKKYLEEYEKRFLTRLIISIPFSLADSFLDYLVDCNNGIDTNYQAIYYILGDARIKRYIPFVDETLTRRQYVFAIYQLWTASKYNFYHIPNGVTPIVGNINPNAYFIQNSHEFKLNNALVFNTGYYFTEEGITKQGFEYSANFIHDKIRIFKTEKTELYKNKYIDDGLGAPAVKSLPLIKLPEEMGNFHMYHPISLIGIHPDLEVVLPEASYYPAFIFQYVEEFEDIKEFDAAVSLGIAITIELALAYFTGALSSLKYLNYLKNASRIYQALTNSALAGEQILIWTALEGATNALAISGSILYSYNNYLIQLSNDPSEIEKLEKLNIILFWLILAQDTASVTFRYKAINAADEFLNTFPSGVIHPDVENLLVTLRTQKATNILGIRQKLIDLGFEENIIVTKFDDFGADVKIAFWNDFKRLSKEEWKLVNKTETLKNWKDLYDIKIIDRADLTVITNLNKTNTVVNYYKYPSLKKVLEPLEHNKRWIYFQKFEIESKLNATAFNRMANDPIRLKLCLAHLDDIKQGKNILSSVEIKEILNSNLENLFVEFKIIDIENSLKACSKQFNNIANHSSLSNQRLINIHIGEFDEVNISNFSRRQKTAYEGGSKLIVKIQTFNNNTSLGDLITEKYIAGYKTPQKVFNILNSENLPHNFKDFDDYTDFNLFSLKAFDIDDVERFKDAEKKFIFNFIREHWNKGNRFVLELESTIDICTSCEGYLTYLKNLGDKNNKIIEYKIISNNGIKNTESINKLTN